MANDFDEFPINDPLVKNGTNKMSDIWVGSISGFYMNLIGYLTQYGMLLPQLTTEERDEIQDPQSGQMIFNTTLNTGQYFKIIASVGTWVNF